MLEEAEFYNITELIRMVKQRIDERDAKREHVSRHRHVYILKVQIYKEQTRFIILPKERGGARSVGSSQGAAC